VLILPINEVKPGAKLALSVMHPRQRDQELLKAGFLLDDTIIKRLKSMEVQQIFVDFPGLDDLDDLIAPTLSPERQQIYEQIKTTIAGNEKSTRPVVKFGSYVSATRDFVKIIMSRPQNAVLLDILHKTDDEVAHATGVAHLAIVLGLKLDAYLIRERSRLSAMHAKDVTNLGVAGMLHDIGKSKLPPELRQYHSLNLPKSEADLAEWEKHAYMGFEMIRGEVDATTSATVLHHHQRFDGKGFPDSPNRDPGTRPSGSQIHCFARILAVADMFERLSAQSNGISRTNYQVLHVMKTKYASWFDPEVLATLPQVIPPFSPGRRVRLSDDTDAIVAGFSPYTPYQPLVKRIDVADLKLTGEAVDLRDSKLTITAIDGQSLTDLENAEIAYVPPPAAAPPADAASADAAAVAKAA
jgi:HD-GYP domain-containing protein (c-di-GMP phosphodiesterase class II)